MYLTTMQIEPAKEGYLLAPERIMLRHSWISDSLKQIGKRPMRYLWRIEKHQENYHLILLSETLPNTQVLNRFGIAKTALTVFYRVDLKLKQKYAFKLVANPTKRISQTRKIVQLTSADDQLAWLKQKAAKSGFNLTKARITGQNKVTLAHNQQKPTILQSVTFKGQLEITDLTAFKKALTHGLGREKAYGFGLLTIKAV